VRIVQPAANTSVIAGSPVILSADATDNDGGIKYVQFFLGDQLLTTKPSAPYELTYPFDVVPGTYVLRAKATDWAGHTMEDSVTITVQQ
jgi:hypothetical protein